MSTVLVTGPTVEPIALAEAKKHLRRGSDFTQDDDYITGLIARARYYVEKMKWKALTTQTWALYLDEFPTERAIKLNPTPVQSVTSVKYTLENDTTQTFAATNYYVDTASVPARIVLDQDSDWPGDTLREANGVEVTFVAGYGDNANDVPENIKHAMLLLIGHWYENREPIYMGTTVTVVPFQVYSLLELELSTEFA